MVRVLNRLRAKDPKKLLRNGVLAVIVCLVISGLASAIGGHRHPLHYPVAIGCDFATFLGGGEFQLVKPIEKLRFDRRFSANSFCENYYWEYENGFYPNIACAGRRITREEYTEASTPTWKEEARQYKCEGVDYHAREEAQRLRWGLGGELTDQPLISHFEIDDPDYYQSALASPYEPSSQITELVDQMGLTAVGQELFFEARPEFTNGPVCQRGPVKAARGCFSRFGNGKTRITIADLDDQKVLVEIAAHELLHAVYYDLSEAKQAEVNELIDTAYSRNQDRLDRRLKPYGQLPTEKFYSELHSFIGSTITDIPAPLEAHYGRYFTDRIGRVVNSSGSTPTPTPPTATTGPESGCQTIMCQVEGIISRQPPTSTATPDPPQPPPVNSDGQWGEGWTTLPDIDPSLSCIAKLGILAGSMQDKGASMAAVIATLTSPNNLAVYDQEYPGCYNEWLPTIESWRAADTNASEAADRQTDRLWDTLNRQNDKPGVKLKLPEPVY